MKAREELREVSERERKRFGLPSGEKAALDAEKYLQLVHRVRGTNTAMGTGMRYSLHHRHVTHSHTPQTRHGFRDLITFVFDRDPESGSIAITGYGVRPLMLFSPRGCAIITTTLVFAGGHRPAHVHRAVSLLRRE